MGDIIMLDVHRAAKRDADGSGPANCMKGTDERAAVAVEGRAAPLPRERDGTQVPDDEEPIVQRAIAGDEDAFAVLFDRYFTMVYRRLLSHLSDPSEAEDMAQEVFARAWRALGNYRQYGVPFRSWLLTITHNLTVDWYRRRSRTARLVQQVAVMHRVHQRDATDGLAEQVCSRMVLRNAMDRLKPEYREVLNLKFLTGLDYAEMAQLLGKRDSNVRTLVYRALKQLRRVVEAAA